MITLETTVRSTPSHTTVDLRDDAVVLDLSTKIYYSYNGVGQQIWTMIHDPVRVAAVRDRLVERFDVDAERCERELVAFLEKLEAQGLVTVVEEDR